MGIDFFRRVRATSVVTALLIFWFVAAYWNVGTGVAWLLGCLWSLVNLYFIGLLVRTLLSRGSARRLRIAIIFLVKVPVLYAIGFLLVTNGRLPLIALLAGSMWPLVVITLKVLGRAVLRMDEPRRMTAAEAKLVERGLQR
jgi:hypothetical protein